MKSKVIMASGRAYIIDRHPGEIEIGRSYTGYYDAQELPTLGAPLESEKIYFNMNLIATVQAYYET